MREWIIDWNSFKVANDRTPFLICSKSPRVLLVKILIFLIQKIIIIIIIIINNSDMQYF
jgi:5-bromo-4-chloroindolyl phosphate hydrolysis protein